MLQVLVLWGLRSWLGLVLADDLAPVNADSVLDLAALRAIPVKDNILAINLVCKFVRVLDRSNWKRAKA